jgi:hypothetical protein
MVDIKTYECQRCKHAWITRLERLPLRCPACWCKKWKDYVHKNPIYNSPVGAEAEKLQDKSLPSGDAPIYNSLKVQQIKKHRPKFEPI